MNKNDRLKAILIIGLALGFGFTISVVSAAPPIAVTSAEPDNAEQGTINLTVKINGRGFDNNMDVKFCRSETNDTCVDGGVDVQPGSVKFINPKQLEVTVNVGLEAVIGKFDIEAISLSSRRRGRGIEKFAVQKATGGPIRSGLFTVTVFFDVGGTFIEAGSKVNVPGEFDSDAGQNRARLGETKATMMLDLSNLETTLDPNDPCNTDFGAPDGFFTISTARPTDIGEFTFVSADFFDFTAGMTEVTYSLTFNNGDITNLNNWLPRPATTNTLLGDEFWLRVGKGREKKGPCNGIIMQNWKIDVTNEEALP